MPRPLLIDTDVMVDFLRGHAMAVALLRENSARIMLSSVVTAELYAGVRDDEELKTLNVKHYPMIKGLNPAYRKT